MTTDRVNAVFEWVGAALMWCSAWELARAGAPAGIVPAAIWWSTVWAFWCIPYYLKVRHSWSLCGAVCRAAATLTWSLLSVLS